MLVAGFAPLLAAPAVAQCELQELTAATPGSGAEFGFSVDLDGDLAAIASYMDSTFVSLGGSVSIFKRDRGQWVEVTTVFASDTDVLDRFGNAVSVSAGTVAVGARYNQDAGYGTGAVYLFEEVAGVWTEMQKLTAGDAAQSTLFGASIDLDGDLLVVGAERGHGVVLPEINIGAAYVYARQGGTWVEIDKLNASDYASEDKFGGSIAISGDRVLVGSREDDDLGPQSGSAYLYERQGSVWLQTGKLVASDGSDQDLFGHAVDIDGDLAVVGASVADGVAAQSGAVYVFERFGGSYLPTAKLMANDGESGDFFGFSVAISGDTIVVGAWADDDGGSQSGAAYVFERDGSGWTQTHKLVAGSAGALEFFGHDVAVDGRTVMVGVKDGHDVGGQGVGTTSVFSLPTVAAAYGTGCAGTGGFVPSLSLSGCLSPGGDVSLDITDGLGGSVAWIVFGIEPAAIPLEPFVGCTLNLQPLLPPILILPLTPGGPGDGSLSLQGTIPLETPPATFTMQAFVQDPSLAFGFVGSNGLQVTLE